MPPAVAAAGIVAAGTIGGAVLGSKSQKSAAQAANDTQQASTAAQLQLGQQSLALNEKLAGQSLAAGLGIYNSNYNLLSPFVGNGLVAGNQINALLGLPQAPAMASPLANGIPGVTLPGQGAPGGGGTPAPAAGMTMDQWY